MVEVFSGIGEGAFLCANRGFLEVDINEKDLKVQGLRVENCTQRLFQMLAKEAIPRLLVGSLSFILPY